MKEEEGEGVHHQTGCAGWWNHPLEMGGVSENHLPHGYLSLLLLPQPQSPQQVQKVGRWWVEGLEKIKCSSYSQPHGEKILKGEVNFERLEMDLRGSSFLQHELIDSTSLLVPGTYWTEVVKVGEGRSGEWAQHHWTEFQ